MPNLLHASYPLLRSLLFKIDAERAHHLTMDLLQLSEKTSLLSLLGGSPPSHPVECMGLTFPNPVGLAAGLDKEGSCIDALGQLGFGFVEIGTITPKPQDGNPSPRLFRLPEHQALINRMGFNNPGITQGVENVRRSSNFQGPIGFNIGKNKVTPNEDAISDYLIGYRAAYEVADYVAVNLSSPNTPGLRDLQSADTAARLIEALKKEAASLEKEHGRRVPIALKVAPDLDDQAISDLSRVFLDTGLDAVIATNTTIERAAVAGHTNAEEAGGLSGAPLTTKSTEVISSFSSALGGKLPIIAAGGIMTADHALDKLNAGATLVQLYTGFVYAGPQLITDIVNILKKA